MYILFKLTEAVSFNPTESHHSEVISWKQAAASCRRRRSVSSRPDAAPPSSCPWWGSPPPGSWSRGGAAAGGSAAAAPPPDLLACPGWGCRRRRRRCPGVPPQPAGRRSGTAACRGDRSAATAGCSTRTRCERRRPAETAAASGPGGELSAGHRRQKVLRELWCTGVCWANLKAFLWHLLIYSDFCCIEVIFRFLNLMLHDCCYEFHDIRELELNSCFHWNNYFLCLSVKNHRNII